MRHPNVQRRLRAARKRESRLFYELRRQKREAAAEKPQPAPVETPAGWLGAMMLVAVTAILIATVTCAILFS